MGGNTRRDRLERIGAGKQWQTLEGIALGLVMIAGWQRGGRGELITGLVAEHGRLLVTCPCMLLVLHLWVALVDAACSVTLPYRLWVLVDIMMAV